MGVDNYLCTILVNLCKQILFLSSLSASKMSPSNAYPSDFDEFYIGFEGHGVQWEQHGINLILQLVKF